MAWELPIMAWGLPNADPRRTPSLGTTASSLCAGTTTGCRTSLLLAFVAINELERKGKLVRCIHLLERISRV